MKYSTIFDIYVVKISVHTLILGSYLKLPGFRVQHFKTEGSGAVINTVSKGYSPVVSFDISNVLDSEVNLSSISVISK